MFLRFIEKQRIVMTAELSFKTAPVSSISTSKSDQYQPNDTVLNGKQIFPSSFLQCPLSTFLRFS